MSVGLGRIERRVLKVLEWERQHHGGALHHLLDYSSGKRAYQECDSTVTELVDSILYGCTEDDHDYTLNRSDKVYRSLYQSVSRAVRTLEKKELIKTGKGYLFWEDGGWYKTVMLTNGTKHLRTAEKDVGVNV